MKGQSYAIAASTTGMSDNRPNSDAKGATLQVRPVDSKMKACLPITAILACESSSVRGSAVDTDETIACSCGIVKVACNVLRIASHRCSFGMGLCDASSFHFLFFRMDCNDVEVAGNRADIEET